MIFVTHCVDEAQTQAFNTGVDGRKQRIFVFGFSNFNPALNILKRALLEEIQMKKLLLAGTAIVAFAATPAHAELDLDLGGYYYGYIGYVDQDNDLNKSSTDLRRDTEVHFKGETTLDNGLTVGVKIELEAENANVGGTAADPIDENNIYFAGNWGKVIMGSEDSASYLLQVVAPAADELVDGYDPKFRFFDVHANFGADNDYGMTYSEDTDKITYITPKFNGFQAGVSYTPDVQAFDGTKVGGLGAMYIDNTADTVVDVYDAAVRYDGEFEGVGVAVGAGYTLGKLGQEQTSTLDDYAEWNVGLSTSFDALTLGVAYNTDNGAADSDEDTENWVFGANYEYGPYTFGASYFNSQYENGANADDELDRYSVGATYAFGPGMTFRGSVNVYDYDDGETAAASNDAVSVLLGTAVNF